jgi:hypothetical protein
VTELATTGAAAVVVAAQHLSNEMMKSLGLDIGKAVTEEMDRRFKAEPGGWPEPMPRSVSAGTPYDKPTIDLAVYALHSAPGAAVSTEHERARRPQRVWVASETAPPETRPATEVNEQTVVMSARQASFRPGSMASNCKGSTTICTP